MPLAPHQAFALEPTPGLWQVPLGSQHPEQLLALHVPPSPLVPPSPATQAPETQTLDPEQALHAPPRMPQALGSVPAWQRPAAVQHPLQLAGKHEACVGAHDDCATPNKPPTANPAISQRIVFMVAST